MITKKDMYKLLALALCTASTCGAQVFNYDWNNYSKDRNRTSITINRYSYENPFAPQLRESITVTGKGNLAVPPLGYVAPLLPNYGIAPSVQAPSFNQLTPRELQEFQKLLLDSYGYVQK